MLETRVIEEMAAVREGSLRDVKPSQVCGKTLTKDVSMCLYCSAALVTKRRARNVEATEVRTHSHVTHPKLAWVKNEDAQE